MIGDEASWGRVQTWLVRERTLTLARGTEFRVRFDRNRNELVVIPSETGIERRAGRIEWQRFVERFNEVERAGYDPMKPGHYPRVTFNSSYLVAIARGARLNELQTSREA